MATNRDQVKRTMTLKEQVEVAQLQAAKAQAERDAIKAQLEAKRISEQDVAENDVLIPWPGAGQSRRLLSTLIKHRYASLTNEELKFIGDPMLFIKDPDPNYEYWLPDADDSMTAARIRGKEFIPVKMEEMNPDAPAPIFADSEGNVRHKRWILVKVEKEYAERAHRGPEQDAIMQLVGEKARFVNEVEEKTKGLGRAEYDLKVTEKAVTQPISDKERSATFDATHLIKKDE